MAALYDSSLQGDPQKNRDWALKAEILSMRRVSSEYPGKRMEVTIASTRKPCPKQFYTTNAMHGDRGKCHCYRQERNSIRSEATHVLQKMDIST